MQDTPPLLSIHLTSNRPSYFVTFLDRLEESTEDPRSVEVVLKIDDTDAPMNALLASESKRRPFRITYISTPLVGGFYELWRSYDELLRISHPDAYFVVGLNDEMYFMKRGWDTRLRTYVGLYPDHIFRLRTSIHRERNTFDYWEASCAGDLTPIMTKRWLDLGGGWCPCNGPDSFQNAVAYYFGWLYRHDTFNRPYRERVVHDIEFGGYGANRGITDRVTFRKRIRGSVAAWFTLVSYCTQQEAARRAQLLHAHIAAAARGLRDYDVIDERRRRSLAVIDRGTGARVWQARYALNPWRIRATNLIRKFNYPFYGGSGDAVRYQRRANLVYYLLLRHERLERAHAWWYQTRAATKRRAASLFPFPSVTRAYTRSLLRHADACIRKGDWESARAAIADARTALPTFGADLLHGGEARLGTLQQRMTTPPSAGTRLGLLLQHRRRPSVQSCADALQFAPGDGERLWAALLHYTVNPPFNLWAVLPAMDIRRVALFGGDAWAKVFHQQLAAAGVTCAAVIDNNPGTRNRAVIAARHYSQPEFVAERPNADAVVSAIRGDHDRSVLPALQDQLGPTIPVLSWKMIFSLLADSTSDAGQPSSLTRRSAMTDARS